MSLVKIGLISTGFVLFGICQSPTPNAGSGASRWEIPEELRASLASRLSLFTSAQADGHWDIVEAMLGKYWVAHQNYPAENIFLTPVRRKCVLSRMRKSPILSFEVKKVLHSTEIYSTPVSRRWWYLSGAGVVKTESGQRPQTISVSAYRDGGEWYFTPFDYQGKCIAG